MRDRYFLYGSLLRHILLNVYRLEGQFEGDTLRTLVADDDTTLPYIISLLYPEGAKVSEVGKIYALKACNLVEQDADLVVVGANRLLTNQYMRHGFRIIPKWVQLFLPVQQEPYARLDSFGSQTRHYFKRMINKIEDAGYECETVDTPSWFSQFYHEMYKPYVLERFNDNAEIHEPRILEKFLSKGEIVIAKKDGKAAAGAIIYQTDGVLHMPFLGITGGDNGLLQDGAMFAVHYYLAKMAHSRGCVFMDFGLCRPFLSDGTLKYKLNWHMEVRPYESVAGVFAVAAPGCTPQAVKFLDAHPHFSLAQGRCRRSDKQAADNEP